MALSRGLSCSLPRSGRKKYRLIHQFLHQNVLFFSLAGIECFGVFGGEVINVKYFHIYSGTD